MNAIKCTISYIKGCGEKNHLLILTYFKTQYFLLNYTYL